MKVLIIHLVRFGDVIQTLHVADCIRQQHPACDVHMLTEKGLSFFPEHHPSISRAIPFDGEACAELLTGATTWEQFSSATRALIDTINAEKYDHVINYQHGFIGPQLMKYIRAGRKSGSALNETNHAVLLDPWTKFLFLTAKKRKTNPWNVVMHYARIAGVSVHAATEQLTLSSEEWAFAKGVCSKVELSLDDDYICLQCGASRDFRRWPEEYFERVVAHLEKSGSEKIVLVGSGNERALSDAIVHQHPSVISLVGRTSFADLVAVVSRAKLLVTNDTGTMHLGAMCRVPSVAIGLSEVSARETAPLTHMQTTYVQPRMSCHPCEQPMQCRSSFECRVCVAPERVIAGIETLLQGSASSVSESEHSFATDRMTVRAIDGQYYYVPDAPCTIDGPRLAEECMRELLPYMWEYIHTGESSPAVSSVRGVLSLLWRWNAPEGNRARACITDALSMLTDIIRRGLAIIGDYEQAIALDDVAGRKTCCRQMEVIDQEMAGLDGLLIFFNHYYSLEYRLVQASKNTLQAQLVMNAHILNRMHAMVEYIEKTVHENIADSSVCHEPSSQAPNI